MSKTPQQRWNESNSQVVLESKRKYNKKHKQINISLDKEENRDLIDWYNSLSKQEKSQFFSALVDFMDEYKNRSVSWYIYSRSGREAQLSARWL